METYLRSCHDLLKGHVKNHSKLLHVVMGNEACDMDSMVSALTFAYFLSKTLDPGKAALPVLNIPRAEFPLRSDSVFLLRECGLSQDYLLFRDDVDLHRMQNLAITLVDHNVLPEADMSLENAVVEVIDHHRLDRTPTPHCPVTVETVGSCATLVTERILQKAPELLDQQVAKLLYGTIITDCVNMAPEAGKVTPKDSQYVSQLETRFPKLPSRSIFFQSLQNAKFDVSGLTTEQMMLKDMKSISGGDLKLAVCAIYMKLEEFLQRQGIQQELCEFCQKHNYNLVVAMTISFINNEPFRQLAVYSSNSHYRNEVIKALDKARTPNLNLIPLSSPYTDVKAFDQGNTLASRKKVLPIISDFLIDREGKMADGSNLEDLELEDECTQEPVDSKQCCEDTVMEDDSGVPPTPMNSLVEGCPLDNGLPKINADVLVEKVSRIASVEEDELNDGTFPHAAKALTHQGMDSTKPLKVSCGIQHQDFISRSYRYCKLQGEPTKGSDLFVQNISEMGGQIDICGICRPNQPLDAFLKLFLNVFCSVEGRIILLKETSVIRE